MARLVGKAVGGLQHLEFGTAVERVTGILPGGLEALDVFLGECVALVEELVDGGQTARHDLRPQFAVAHSREAAGLYAVRYQVVDHRLGPVLREAAVVELIAAVVAVRTQFDARIGVVLEQAGQIVERLARVVGQLGAVKLVEDIAHEDGRIDRRQREIERIGRGDVGGVDVEVLLIVEEAVAGGQQDVLDAGLDLLLETAVGAHAKVDVRAVVAHHVDTGLRQLVAVLLVDVAEHGVDHLGLLKGVDMIPSAAVLAIGGEVAAIVHALESHREVIARRVDRRGKDLHGPLARHRVLAGAVDVEAAHTRVTVGGEIEFAVGAEGGEHLIAGAVDRRAEILHRADAVAVETRAPDVISAQAARHIGDEIEPASVGRDGGMSVGGERIG